MVSAVIVVAFMILQIVPFGTYHAQETGPMSRSGTGENETFPAVHTFENASWWTNYIILSRDTMIRANGFIYQAFVELGDNDTKGIALTRSGDNGTTWADPVHLWNLSDNLAMRVFLIPYNGTLYCFVNQYVELAWTTWSFFCIEVPLDDWRNSTKYTTTRMDDTDPGYIATFNAFVFHGEVYLMWTRSHYMDCLYRVRDVNGTWGPIRYLNVGTYFSRMSAMVSNISGISTIYLLYTYTNTNSIHITTSTDGSNWTSPKNLFYLADEPDQVEMIEYNGRFHLVVSERLGYDVFYTNSGNGSQWAPLQKIGEKAEQFGSDLVPPPLNVAITASDSRDMIYVAHDNKGGGIAVVYSRDNGSSFGGPVLLNNSNYSLPNFDPEGEFLMHMEGEDKLVMRSLYVNISDFEPPDGDDNSTDDNDTTPEEPVEEPDDNSTEDNGTAPEEPVEEPDDDSMEDNGTAPEDNGPPDPLPLTLEPDDIEIEVNPANLSRKPESTLLSAVLPTGIDPDRMGLTFIWTVEGTDIIAAGQEVELTLSPGRYTISLEVRDLNGTLARKSIIFDVPMSPECSDKEDGSMRTIAFFVMVLVLLSLAVFLFILSLTRRRSRGSVEADTKSIPPHTGSPPDTAADDGVRTGYLSPTDRGITLTPGLHVHGREYQSAVHVPEPHPAGNARAMERKIPNMDDLKDEVLSRDFHQTFEDRKQDILSRAERHHRDGRLDESSFNSIRELLE